MEDAIKGHKNIIITITMISLLNISIVVMRVLTKASFKYVFLVWNLFLCWVPLFFALILKRRYTQNNKLTALDYIIGSVWLLFYPNAPYIVTDILHLSLIDFFPNLYTYIPDTNLQIWYDFLMLMLFVFTGLFIAGYALYLVQRVIKNCTSSIFSWVFVGGVLILSSFAIYLGRFIRLNSWELFYRPIGLFGDMLSVLGKETIMFVGMFFGFLMCLYLFFYQIINHTDD